MCNMKKVAKCLTGRCGRGKSEGHKLLLGASEENANSILLAQQEIQNRELLVSETDLESQWKRGE